MRLIYSDLPLDQQQKPESKVLVTLALAELNKAVAMGAQAPEVFDDLGALLQFSGQVKEAITAYSKGLELSALATLRAVPGVHRSARARLRRPQRSFPSVPC